MFMFDFQPSSQWQHWRGSSGPWVQGALIFVPLFPSHSTLFPEPHLLYLLRRKKPYYLQSLAGQGSRRSLRSSKTFSISIISLLVNPRGKVFTKPRTIFPWDDSQSRVRSQHMFSIQKDPLVYSQIYTIPKWAMDVPSGSVFQRIYLLLSGQK